MCGRCHRRGIARTAPAVPCICRVSASPGSYGMPARLSAAGSGAAGIARCGRGTRSPPRRARIPLLGVAQTAPLPAAVRLPTASRRRRGRRCICPLHGAAPRWWRRPVRGSRAVPRPLCVHRAWRSSPALAASRRSSRRRCIPPESRASSAPAASRGTSPGSRRHCRRPQEY